MLHGARKNLAPSIPREPRHPQTTAEGDTLGGDMNGGDDYGEG